MAQQVKITIPRDRTKPVKTEVNGCQGTSCSDLTKTIESALGTVTSTEATAEMYEKPEQQHELQRGT